MPLTTARRALWLGLLFLLAFAGLSARLYFLQVVREPSRAQEAVSERMLTVPLAADRGAIYDRNGVPLTNSTPVWGVAAFPPLVPDVGFAAQELAPIIGKKPADIAGMLMQKGILVHSAVKLAKGLNEAQRAAITGLKLPGIALVPIYDRYSEVKLARHVVGIANAQGDREGLEAFYDHELSGKDVPTLAVKLDARDQLLDGQGLRTVIPMADKAPADVYTTIDQQIQQAVEAALDSQPNKLEHGAAVVLDARTGEVLAMASRPAKEAFNRAVEGQYPPGSTFKPFVAAEAIETGAARMDDQFHCDGHYDLGTAHFTDVDGHHHGDLTLRDAIAESCNITFIKVGYERLGAQRLLEAAKRFGFGQPTGVPLPGEPSGHLPALSYPADVAQFAFGQDSFTVTPLQMARAYAALANGGELPGVRLVTEVKEASGRVVARPDVADPKRVISAETARQVQQALKDVTDHGTGTLARLPVGSAGKTGTAEDGDPTNDGWFAGYFPADAPRYVVVVLAEHGGYGSNVAAPLFARIGERILAIEKAR